MQQAVLVVFSLSALLSSVSLYHQVPSYMIHGCGIYDMTIFFKYLPFLPNSTTSLLTSARQGNGCYDRYCLLASYQPGMKCSQTGRTAVHSATAIEKLHVRVCEAKGCLSVSGHSSATFLHEGSGESRFEAAGFYTQGSGTFAPRSLTENVFNVGGG